MSNPNPVPPPPARGRPKGSRNAAVLANQALNEYRRNLLKAADAGDINAAGWLLMVNAIELREERNEK